MTARLQNPEQHDLAGWARRCAELDAVIGKSEPLLAALRDRAIQRNAVRNEMRERTRKGESAIHEETAAWTAYKRAESALQAALIAWEASEGIDDGTAEIMKPREPASE